MDKLLEDYKAYYATRAKRYAGNPIFHRSAIAERNLSDAMQSCSALDEFKNKLGNLNHLCATAMTLDKSEYFAKVFNELQETVRAKGNSDVVQKCANIQDVNELIRVSVEILLNNSKDISRDQGTLTYFKSELSQLEQIDIYENTPFPAAYQKEAKESAEELKAEVKESLIDSKKEYQKYHPDFDFEWDKLWEHRHRKLIPLPDDVMKKRINEIKTYLNA